MLFRIEVIRIGTIRRVDGLLQPVWEVTIQPGLAEAYTHRSVFYLNKGLTDQAIADCSKAIAIEPDYAQPYYERGLAKKAKGDMTGGDADIARAKQLNPNTGK